MKAASLLGNVYNMHAIWSGSISFGLVNIPVKLYSATGGEKISFNLLHEEDISPIRYARVCKLEGRELSSEEIVKGYEYEKGRFIVVSDDDFIKADVKRSRSIEILNFVDEGEIDDIYFEKPYYLEPDRGADKPYVLLREALRRSKRVGIAKFVLRNREHLAAIVPSGEAIMLNRLRFAEEIRSAAGLNLPPAEVAVEEEVEMALALIDKLVEPFEPEKFRDTYYDSLMTVINEKIRGEVPSIRGIAPVPTPVKDIMAALKASLEREEKKKPA